MPTNVTLDTQNALAGLRKWNLRRDDSNEEFPHRVYRDDNGNVYSSVTHILNETAPQEQKDALERWSRKPTAAQERDVACKRGHLAHAHAEYVLKTSRRLAFQAANKRGLWKTGGDCLERCPSKVTSWAIQKALQGAPTVGLSASGFARGLASFIESSITAIHAVEFSIHYTPKNAIHDEKNAIHGFAGTADCLVDVQGDGPYICDWKTSVNARSDALYEQFYHQLAAYYLGLERLTGIRAKGGVVVCARRSGTPTVKIIDQVQLMDYSNRFLERFDNYRKGL